MSCVFIAETRQDRFPVRLRRAGQEHGTQLPMGVLASQGCKTQLSLLLTTAAWCEEDFEVSHVADGCHHDFQDRVGAYEPVWEVGEACVPSSVCTARAFNAKIPRVFMELYGPRVFCAQ